VLASVFEQGKTVRRDVVELKQGRTEPSAAYTEATLLGAMEHALRGLITDEELDDGESAPEGGLGTPATRASILETLIRSRLYVERQGKSLVSTSKGRGVIAALGELELTSASWTAQWERALGLIEAGKLDAGVFLTEVKKFTTSAVGTLRARPSIAVTGKEPVGVCPLCKEPLRAWPKNWSCQGKGCGFILWAEISGKKLSESQARELLAGKTTRVLKGFMTREKKPFETALRLNAQGKVEFVTGTTEKKK
jgi:DNA topoisomerase-3